jgi:hypothetical protein
VLVLVLVLRPLLLLLCFSSHSNLIHQCGLPNVSQEVAQLPHPILFVAAGHSDNHLYTAAAAAAA